MKGWQRFALVAALMAWGCEGREASVGDPAVVVAEVSPQEQDDAVLHERALVIDTHSDTTPRFQDPDWDFLARHERDDGHMDLPRMREGGLDVQFWSIYMGRREGEGRAIAEALARIDAVHELVAAHPEQLAFATSAAEVWEHAKSGRMVSLMGLEGGHIIEDDLAALRNFYRLGVRYMTLTHSFHTNWADSSGTVDDTVPRHGGLSPFGEEVVAEMNRLGMMVDISHVSDDTFWDVLEVTRAPVIASHSAIRAVADHRRNLSDPMLEALAANGGVVMINFYSAYVDERVAKEMAVYYEQWGDVLAGLRERYAEDLLARGQAFREHFKKHPLPDTSLEVLLDHFDHAIAVAGPDHVGLGADWDGVASMPVGMKDVSDLPNLTRGLRARGHSPQTVRKVLGENLLRVMAAAEEVGEAMRAERWALPGD